MSRFYKNGQDTEPSGSLFKRSGLKRFYKNLPKQEIKKSYLIHLSFLLSFFSLAQMGREMRKGDKEGRALEKGCRDRHRRAGCPGKGRGGSEPGGASVVCGSGVKGQSVCGRPCGLTGYL